MKRPRDVRGDRIGVELELEASHPRIAGIVQTHRQHIDALDGRHGVMTKDIDQRKVSGAALECQAAGFG
jgi:hypothetical protein